MQSRFIRLLGLALVLTAVCALRVPAQEMDLSKAPRITLAEFKKLFEAHDVVVVDVRDEASFKAAHIPGALSIPSDQVTSRAEQLQAEKKPIVTYCA